MLIRSIKQVVKQSSCSILETSILSETTIQQIMLLYKLLDRANNARSNNIRYLN